MNRINVTGHTGPKEAVDTSSFIQQLRSIVGAGHVITDERLSRPYREGRRFGTGSALAVVRPGTLIEQWRVLELCIAADKIVIMQAANTGLTGGSTPDGNNYERDVVIINAMRIRAVHLINDGAQVVCLPGTTLHQLESVLASIGREPHSVIGSSCIGASVFGGICNNSGGSLVHRGPAFTQLALFARHDRNGKLRLVNHLGIDLGDDPHTILERVEKGQFADEHIINDDALMASDRNYATHVRDVDAATPARYNADPSRLYEASGSAGKVMLLAVRLDTFPKVEKSAVFYLGTNDGHELELVRRHVLSTFNALPIAGEYMDRTAFDIAEKYGKDIFLAVRWLGTDFMPTLFALQSRLDAFCERVGFLPRHASDKVLQLISKIFPPHLPSRLTDYRDRFEHHLALKVSEEGIYEARQYLQSIFPSGTGDFFECTVEEGSKAFLHRFAAAGAANRYRALHEDRVEDIVALDVALRRNDHDWQETLPQDIENVLIHKLYYGHFMCHVLHQDYIVAKGSDCSAIKKRMLEQLNRRGAECPAEHNVGHLYHAKPALVEHYRALDPCNTFNPGVGLTTKCAHWGMSKTPGEIHARE